MEFLKVINLKAKYRFHIIGLVHLPCSKKYLGCAFTQKNLKLAKMLMDKGHEVYYYGAEGSDVPCTKFIQTHTIKQIANTWGDGDNRFEIGYDWKATGFRHDFNTTRTPLTNYFNQKVAEEINKIKQPDDFLVVTMGTYQKPIVDAVKLFLTVETGIGYRGSFAKYRAFESTYIQNFTYGSQHPFESINGNYYDRVIPNYFDKEDIEFSETPKDYYLYIGRLIQRKGVLTAIKACNFLNKKLLIAGQGGKVVDGKLIGEDFEAEPGTWEYIGYVDLEERKKLFAGAIATFVPTEYLEPFAGTHVESMLSGTPVITTDFGVFPDTVINGVNGFRCHTLQDFVYGAVKAPGLNRIGVAKLAEKYLMDNVVYLYLQWFDELHNVWESTISDKKGWHRLE